MVTLLDEAGCFVDEVDQPEPLKATVVHDGKVYLKLRVKGTRYREIPSYWTPTGSLETRRWPPRRSGDSPASDPPVS